MQIEQANNKPILTFQSCPDEVKLHIFSFLKPADLGKCASVCREWKCLSEDDSLWKQLGNGKTKKELNELYTKNPNELIKKVEKLLIDAHKFREVHLVCYSSNEIFSETREYHFEIKLQPKIVSVENTSSLKKEVILIQDKIFESDTTYFSNCNYGAINIEFKYHKILLAADFYKQIEELLSNYGYEQSNKDFFDRHRCILF